ncbi:MAG: AbrB/MazE/SpoVT family DNA-binding domain-containing protein [Methylocystis sp.]|nr:AbrB/MazE/SpoVT family DNA-binding domain-containing protein [Methylocystis sp.]
MGGADKRRVRLSTKGQVVLPKSIRQRRNWESGASLTIEETAEGVLLKEASLFAPTKLEDVFGMLSYAGPPKSVEEMDASLLAEAKRRNAGG